VIREVALHARGEASHLIQKYSTCVCRIGASTPHTATSHTARDGPSARPHRRSLGTRLFRPTSLASQGLAGSNHSCGGVSSKKMALRPLASERPGPGCTASTAGPAVLAQWRDGTRAPSYHSTQKNSIQCVPNPRCVEPGTRGTPVAHPWHTRGTPVSNRRTVLYSLASRGAGLCSGQLSLPSHSHLMIIYPRHIDFGGCDLIAQEAELLVDARQVHRRRLQVA